MDAGDADVELVVLALAAFEVAVDGERVLAVAALRVCEASTRASGRARQRSGIFDFRLARATDARATNAIARATDDASSAD